jgi:hypothetical protein
VQLYADVAELSDSVARFLDAGFRAGEPAVVISTPGHWRRFGEDVSAKGWDIDGLTAERLLTVLDAERTLSAFLDEETPSPARFADVVGGVIDEVSSLHPNRTVRAFGEMVDVLQRDGRIAAALALEELWNELARTKSFALLCGYEIDIFDCGVQTGLVSDVIRAHTHSRPVADNALLADAVDRALMEVVGAEHAGRIYLSVADAIPRGSTPRAHAVLNWLSTNDALNAPRILDRARAHYANGATAFA